MSMETLKNKVSYYKKSNDRDRIPLVTIDCQTAYTILLK